MQLSALLGRGVSNCPRREFLKSERRFASEVPVSLLSLLTLFTFAPRLRKPTKIWHPVVSFWVIDRAMTCRALISLWRICVSRPNPKRQWALPTEGWVISARTVEAVGLFDASVDGPGPTALTRVAQRAPVFRGARDEHRRAACRACFSARQRPLG